MSAAVAMLDPTEKELVLDPACGTGGFLITAMNPVIEKIRAALISRSGTNELHDSPASMACIWNNAGN